MMKVPLGTAGQTDDDDAGGLGRADEQVAMRVGGDDNDVV